MAKYFLDTLFRIFDQHGHGFIEIGPDGDGLDLIDLRQVEANKEIARITMNEEQAEMVYIALGKELSRRKAEKGEK